MRQMKLPASPAQAVAQAAWMQTESSAYADRCEEELAAADRAASQEERVAHLENALRFGLLAARSRGPAKPVDLAQWRRERDQTH